MARPKLFSAKSDRPAPHTFNTGTVYDLLTGKTMVGHDGKWYIAGGLGNYLTGLYGPGNSGKSTFLESLVGRVLAIYEGDGEIVDTEGSKDADINRIRRISDGMGDNIPVDRVTYRSGATTSLGELLQELQGICELKEKHMNDLTIESPFLDPSTGKRMKAWIPTVVEVDSLSEMHSEEEVQMMQEQGLDGDKIRTIYMTEGNKKTMFIRKIRKMCEMYGLIVVAVAHKGKNMDISNPAAPAQKKTQHMKQGDDLKNVGSKFYDLTRVLIEVEKSSELMASSDNREPAYCYGQTPIKDLNEMMIKTIRCKSNISGMSFPFVVSQNMGLLNSATHYHYMRKNSYAGLHGSKAKNQCALKPDTTLTRNSVRQQADKDYELSRALKLCAEFLILKNFWVPIPELSKAWEMNIEDLYNELQKGKKSPKISEVLNSVGYWYPDGTCDREYMSIFDVLNRIVNK